MRRFIVVAALACLTVGGSAQAKTALRLTSRDFAMGAAIPTAHEANAFGCSGQNLPLALRWSGVPGDTRSLALTMVDHDAPIRGGFVHWIAYAIPASRRSIDATSLTGIRQGFGSAGTKGYFGPCPPPGVAHRYTITLYALDTRVQAQRMTIGTLLQKMKGHVLARATLVGTFQRSGG
jgi:Raf kinase inhibitor-like YbhB/YbcL family protein